jgi:hypothetical protein
MNTRFVLATCFALLYARIPVPAQGTFQNLWFESATLVPVPESSSYYDFTQAFPGWAGYVGTTGDGLTAYNGLPMATAGFSIVDRRYSTAPGMPGGVIQGNFTAVVISGISGVGEMFDATLEQTSLVPAYAESLQFEAFFDSNHSQGSYFSVSLGGQTLSLVTLGSGANYTLYGADIQGWAGQTAELAFTTHTNFEWSVPAYLYLDSIQFSPQAVPEPSIIAFSALGALLLGWRMRGRPHESGGLHVLGCPQLAHKRVSRKWSRCLAWSQFMVDHRNR